MFLVVVYSVVHLALQIRELGKQFFKALWNWYEMLTTLMALVSIGMYMGCVIEATNTFNRFLDNQTGFTNFERAVYVHVGMRYLHAWLLFLLMFKVIFLKLISSLFFHLFKRSFQLATSIFYTVMKHEMKIIFLYTWLWIGYEFCWNCCHLKWLVCKIHFLMVSKYIIYRGWLWRWNCCFTWHLVFVTGSQNYIAKEMKNWFDIILIGCEAAEIHQIHVCVWENFEQSRGAPAGYGAHLCYLAACVCPSWIFGKKFWTSESVM